MKEASKQRAGQTRTTKAVKKMAAKRKGISKVSRRVKQSKAGTTSVHTHSSEAYGGVKCVSPSALPKGGMKASPAWKLLLARCGVKRAKDLPKPRERLGAPLSERGFPVERWPANVLVDAERVFWLPDDWGQGIKNTGTGGTYIGWVSPEGRYVYHRNLRGTTGVETIVGRPLTALDGFNGMLRRIQGHVPPGADSRFLTTVLTAAEQKHIAPATRFHFCIVSARRADTNAGQHSIMVVEAHFRNAGVRPTWYVDEASVEAYKALSLDVVVGGKLTPARNKALADAAARKKVCVQVSDDISLWEYFDVKKLKGPQEDFSKANAAVDAAERHGKCYKISPVAAAQFILAKMRSHAGDASTRPQLGGVLPQSNPAMGVAGEAFAHQHFILGDFFVVDSSDCRFDPAMTLKEDYDFTCSHLARHGAVLRCNRMIVRAKHGTNDGGAVSERDKAGAKERENIAILMRKWPGAIRPHGRRQNEVTLCWAQWHGHRDGDGQEAGLQKRKRSGAAPGASRKQ